MGSPSKQGLLRHVNSRYFHAEARLYSMHRLTPQLFSDFIMFCGAFFVYTASTSERFLKNELAAMFEISIIPRYGVRLIPRQLSQRGVGV